MGLAFSTLSIVLTVVVVAVVEKEATQHVKQTIGHGLGELALQASDKLDRGMFERYREVDLLAKRFSLADAGLGHDNWRKLLDDVRDTYTYYSWIGLADLQGRVMVSAGGLLEGADVGKRPWFREASKGGGHVGDVHEALLLAKLLPQAEGREPVRFVDVAFPFRDRTGAARGVLGAHMSWQWARDVERSIIAPLEAARQVDALIVGDKGLVLLGPPGLQGTTIAMHSLRQARQQTKPGYVVERWSDGKTYLVGYSRSKGYAEYPGLGWTVLVRQDVENAFVPVKRLRQYGLWSGIALALLFSVAGVFVARWITRPLERLKVEAARIQDGEEAGIAERGRSYDEVRSLASTLNALVEKLQRRQTELEELNLTLEQRVAERTQALEDALAVVSENEQRIHTIVETAQDAFIGMGLDGRVIDWNSAAEQMFGWRREEALGKPMGELVFPKAFLPFHLQSLQRFRETGHLEVLNQRVERIVCNRQGRELQVEMTARLAGGADTTFFSVFMRDIALRKKVEQMKNELVATVSHELRTPLTSMRASLSLLATGAVGGVPDEAGELIDIAYRHCERLVRLVNDMLDVQKIESGKVQLACRDQPLLPLLEDAAGAMRGHAREAGVRIDCGCESGAAELHAEVDADRLTQVLTNLLSNAIKFSADGATVELRLVRHGDGVRISVLDRGPGIPENFRDRIFQRFAQSDEEAARRQGSGLGLSISRDIVEGHGGRLDFMDRERGGTVFHVDLPSSSAATVDSM